MMIKKIKNKKGFTLVELLIVIAVLGIIAGIGVNSMSGISDSFKRKADEKTAEMLARSVEVHVLAGTLSFTEVVTDDEGTVTEDANPATANAKILNDINTAKCQTVKNGTFEVTAFSNSDENNITISFGTGTNGDVTVVKGSYTGTIATKAIE